MRWSVMTDWTTSSARRFGMWQPTQLPEGAGAWAARVVAGWQRTQAWL